MGFFRAGSRTAEQKAKNAKTRILFRVLALSFIVFYVIVPMLNPASEIAEETSPALRYLTAAGFSIAVIVVGIVTVREYIREKKAGRYDAAAYTDDEEISAENEESPDEIVVQDDDDDEDDEYEYEEDEDYEEYDDEDDEDDDDEDDEG